MMVTGLSVALAGGLFVRLINAGLQGVDFVVANTDAQALGKSRAERIIQMGVTATEGLGAGSKPDVGLAAAEEVIDEIRDHLTGALARLAAVGRPLRGRDPVDVVQGVRDRATEHSLARAAPCDFDHALERQAL
jgi:hypothetical protein